MVESLAQVGVFGRLDRYRARRLQLRQAALHLHELPCAVADRGAQRRRADERLVEVRLLGQQTDTKPILALDLARFGRLEPSGDAQQRRLSGAIGTDETNPLVVRDRRVDRVEDDERAHLAPDVGQPQDGHRSAHPGQERGR